MRAYFLQNLEGAVAFAWREAAEPLAGPGQALIRIHAAGVNRGELLLLDRPATGAEEMMKHPTGHEFAGEIVALGSDVQNWRLGQRVMGRAVGSYADYAVADTREMMAVPERMSWAEAAAVPITYSTAHDALFTQAGLTKDDILLVTAAASATGTAVMQLARRAGIRQILATTRSSAKAEALLRAGADGVIDTSRKDWPAAVLKATGGHGVDAIIDHVGGDMLEGNLKALAIGGRLVSVGRNAGNSGPCDLDLLAYKRARLIGTTFRTRSAEESAQCWQAFAEDCQEGLASGGIRPIVDRCFPFEQLAEAHAYMRSDAQLGKLVLTMA